MPDIQDLSPTSTVLGMGAWTVLAHSKLTAAGDSIIPIWTGDEREVLKIHAKLITTGQITPRLRLGDGSIDSTASIYGYTKVENGTETAPSASADTIELLSTQTGYAEMWADITIYNTTDTRKLVSWVGGAVDEDTDSIAFHGSATYHSDSANIDRIEIYNAGTGDFASNSEVEVLGRNFNESGEGTTGAGTGINMSVIKETDQVKNNDAALDDDDELVIKGLPVGHYKFEARIFYSSNPTTGITYDFANTGTMTGRSIQDAWDSVSPASNTNGWTASHALSIGLTDGVQITGYIEVTVAGDFKFRWAQTSATVQDSTIFAGSSLEVRSTGSSGAIAAPMTGLNRTIVKTVDQSNATTTMVDDSELTMTLPVGTYAFTLMLWLSSPATPDYKYGFTGTATYTGDYVTQTWNGTTPPADASISSPTNLTTDGTNQSIMTQGRIIVTVAGTFTFEFSQNNVSGSPATTLKGSSLTVKSTGGFQA